MDIKFMERKFAVSNEVNKLTDGQIGRYVKLEQMQPNWKTN